MTAKKNDGQAKALAKAGDNWKKRTDALRERRRTMAGEMLQYHYDVGLFAEEVVADKANDPKKRLYGSHTVDEISKAISMSVSTVHSCLKFARRIEVKELELLKKAEYPWRAVASLITVEDAKSYKELKDKYEKGTFKNSDQLKDAAKAINDAARKAGTKSKQSGGNSTAASMVKSCNTLLNQATSKVLPGFMRAITEVVKKGDKMSEATVEAVKVGVKEARKNIRATQTLLEKAEKLIEESGV